MTVIEVDSRRVRVFRALFGGLMTLAVVRFFANGWIDTDFSQPTHFLHHWGLEWIRPWPRPWMHVHFAIMGLSAAALAIGWRPRLQAAVFGLLFTYAHLCDVTYYLNHYYLVSLIALLLAVLPVHGETVPAWALLALRAQFGVVYFFGGVAKLGPDWLLRGEPLGTWLGVPSSVAIALGWGAAVFDLTIPFWLSWRRSRPLAFVAVCGFHLATAWLFRIGLFPFIMIAGATLFFTAQPAPAAPRRHPAFAFAVAHVALQLVLPLRSLLYPGNGLWHEQGFRFAWKVMLMEKSGVAELRVREPSTGRTWTVPASRYFTRVQAAMLATQPDLVLQAAHVAAEDARARGVRDPEVRADVFAALNGRPRARLIDPDVDLAAVRDGLGPKPWILEMQ